MCLELETVDRAPEGWVWQPIRRFELTEAEVRAHVQDYAPALDRGSLEHVYAQWCSNLHHWLGEVVGDAFPRDGPCRGLTPKWSKQRMGRHRDVQAWQPRRQAANWAWHWAGCAD